MEVEGVGLWWLINIKAEHNSVKFDTFALSTQYCIYQKASKVK